MPKFECYIKSGAFVIEAEDNQTARQLMQDRLKDLEVKGTIILVVQQQGKDAPWRGGERECHRIHDDGNCECGAGMCDVADGGYGR